MKKIKKFWKKLKYWQKLCILGICIFAISLLLRYPTNALGWHWLYRAEARIIIAFFVIIIVLVIKKIKKK